FIFGLGRVHFRPYTTHPAKTHHTLICLINCDLATEAFSRERDCRNSQDRRVDFLLLSHSLSLHRIILLNLKVGKSCLLPSSRDDFSSLRSSASALIFIAMVSQTNAAGSSARRRRRSTPTPREQARPRKANRYPVSDSDEDKRASSIDSTAPTSPTVNAVHDDSSMQFPTRLFDPGYFPTALRLNIYSKANVIGAVASALAGYRTLQPHPRSGAPHVVGRGRRLARKQPENAPLPPEEKPEVVPIIQRNLRPRKPAVVVVEDVTSSEHNELEVPNQSGSSPDKYLKLWLSEQLQNVARGIYERLETMERNICSHLGVSPPNFHNTRKRKADDDSPKTDGIQAQRPPRKSMRTNSTVTKPTTKIHFYPQRSADRLEEPRAPYAVPDESNAENPVTTSVIDEPPCISDLSPTKRFGDEKSVTVTWEETNPHAYTSGKIALASETPPSVDVETLSRDVSATKTQSAAVTEGATHDSVAVGNERSPVEEDENYESCQENISINTPLQEKHPLAVETLPGPDTDEDDNSVESGGKRLRKKSQKIREVYTPDARLKGLFMSEKKTEYRPLPKTSRAIFKKFSDILTENLVQ
ncbi:hypothetical protein HID58_055789, partial [Brassica napus]